MVFQERLLKVLKCYNFLSVQRRHNCSPTASFANCVMTLYLLKVLLQSYLSIPITQKCQILSCDTLVANELYVVMYQKSLCQVSYMCLFAGGEGGAFFYLHYVLYYSFFILGIFVLLRFTLYCLIIFHFILLHLILLPFLFLSFTTYCLHICYFGLLHFYLMLLCSTPVSTSLFISFYIAVCYIGRFHPFTGHEGP